MSRNSRGLYNYAIKSKSSAKRLFAGGLKIIDALIILYIQSSSTQYYSNMQFPQTVASFKPVTHPISSYVLVFCNPLPAEIDYSAKKSPKYRKVGKATKNHLLDLVEQGSSIISAAKKLGINYSTAKSIIQNMGKGAFKKFPCDSTEESISKSNPPKPLSL